MRLVAVSALVVLVVTGTACSHPSTTAAGSSSETLTGDVRFVTCSPDDNEVHVFNRPDVLLGFGPLTPEFPPSGADPSVTYHFTITDLPRVPVYTIMPGRGTPGEKVTLEQLDAQHWHVTLNECS